MVHMTCFEGAIKFLQVLLNFVGISAFMTKFVLKYCVHTKIIKFSNLKISSKLAGQYDWFCQNGSHIIPLNLNVYT